MPLLTSGGASENSTESFGLVGKRVLGVLFPQRPGPHHQHGDDRLFLELGIRFVIHGRSPLLLQTEDERKEDDPTMMHFRLSFAVTD